MEKNTNRELNSHDVASLYNTAYFLRQVDGFSEFGNYSGKFEELFYRYQQNINMLKLAPQDSLLEIGCGRGEIVIYHALQGGDATGIDFSEDAIHLAKQKAKQLGAKCDFYAMSFENLPENKKYDKILASEFIEHISRDEGVLFFNRCAKLLKKGGMLVVYTSPNTINRKYGYPILRFFSILIGKPLPKQSPDTLHEHYHEYHLNEQNYFTLGEYAKNAGFSDYEIFYLPHRQKTNSILKKILRILVDTTLLKHLFLGDMTLVAKL